MPIGTSPGGCGPTVFGFAVPPRPVQSEPITLQVEETEVPIHIMVDVTFLEIHRADSGNFTIRGVFPDGRIVNLSKSTYTSLKSSAPNVATVTNRGGFSAVAPGAAKITVSYGDLNVDVPVTVLPSPR